jgi:hypothetical protein
LNGEIGGFPFEDAAATIIERSSVVVHHWPRFDVFNGRMEQESEMGKVSVIEQAIRSAESKTRASDAEVIDILRGAGEIGGAPPRYAQLLSAAQALLTGDADLALDRRVDVAPYASWGSWIEGVPFSHALLLNEGVLVDLVPCQTEADFIRNYRCSPDQFMDLTKRIIKTGGEIHFNIRNYDPTRPESLEPYIAQPDFVKRLYVYALGKDAARFYLNSVRRDSLLEMLGAEGLLTRWRTDLGGTGSTAREDGLLRQLQGALAPANAAIIARQPGYRGVFVRGGALPAPIQSFERIVYHLAFSELCPDIPRDGELDALARRIMERGTLPGDALLRACARANDLHHLYTAPITGAYGGTYNLTEHEFAPEEAAEAPVARQADSHNPAFLDFLYASVADRIRVRSGRLEALRTLGRQLSIMQTGQIPEEEELRAFLDFLPEARGFLRKRRELQEALNHCIRRGSGDLSSVDSYVDAADKAFRNCNGIWSKIKGHLFIGGGFALGGAGIGGVAAFGVSLGFLGDMLCKAYDEYRPLRGDLPGGTAQGRSGQARDWLVDRLVNQPCDRRQIVSLMDGLRR